jgi:hypothetical protein
MDSEGIDRQMLLDSFAGSLGGMPEEEDGKVLSSDDEEEGEDEDESSDETTRVDRDEQEIANR